MQRGRKRRVARGDCFFREGDAATLFYILLSGEVKLTQSTLDGQQVIRKAASGLSENANAIGQSLAHEVLNSGGAQILETIKNQS